MENRNGEGWFFRITSFSPACVKQAVISKYSISMVAFPFFLAVDFWMRFWEIKLHGLSKGTNKDILIQLADFFSI